MQKLFAPRKIIFFITLLLALAIATPVLADYLTPNRTVTTTVSVCHMVKYECKEVNGHWKYKRVEDWSCPTGHDACEAGGGACNASDHTGSYCAREEELKDVTTTYPEATITGSIQNCTLQNGWCNGNTVPELALSANEPLAGYNITLIEGDLHGASFACQPGETSCTLQLNQGESTFNYWALSSWGDSSWMGTSSAKVDTIPPDVAMSIAGTAGDNGWYTSAVQVSAVPADATPGSGVASLEVAADGGTYQVYAAAIPFSDGVHTLQFKTTDNAGNLFETSVQNVYVDTIPPTVDLPAAWYLGRSVEYSVRDDGSGLAAVRIVIDDEREKYAKRTWDAAVEGNSHSRHIDWDGIFKDGTVAPPGTYRVWIKARDKAGNEHFELGKIIVPEPNAVGISALPTEVPAVATVPVVPPADLSVPQSVPSAVESAVASETGKATTHTVLLTSGVGAAAKSTTSPGVLWGTAAAAAIGAATAYALETSRKRKEAEEEQAAQARAQVGHSGQHLTKEEKREEKARRAEEHDQKVQDRKERQSWANPAKEKALLKEQAERDAAYQQWLQQQQQTSYTPPPSGISPEAQQAFIHGGANAQQWITNNVTELRATYIKEQEHQKEAAQKWEEKKKAAERTGLKVLAAPALDDPPKDPGPLEKFWNWLKHIFTPGQPASPLSADQMMQTQVANIVPTLAVQQTQTARALPTFTPTIISTPTAFFTPTPSLAEQKMWVTYPANFRSGPSVAETVLTTLGYYTEVQPTGETAPSFDTKGHPVTFYKVSVPSLNGQTGWVVSNFLEPSNLSNVKSLFVDPNKKVLINLGKEFKIEGPIEQYLNIDYGNPDPATGKVSLIPGHPNYNLCGEFSTAYVTKKPIETLLTDWINASDVRIQARARQVIKNPLTELTGYSDLQDMLHMYSCSYQDFLTPLQEPVADGPLITPGRLKAVIDQGNVLITGVNVSQDTGALAQGTIPHWVVLNDILPQGGGNGQVLVYNPMPNRQEIYTYETFLRATANFNVSTPNDLNPSTIRMTGIWVNLASCK